PGASGEGGRGLRGGGGASLRPPPLGFHGRGGGDGAGPRERRGSPRARRRGARPRPRLGERLRSHGAADRLGGGRPWPRAFAGAGASPPRARPPRGASPTAR